MLFAGFVYAWSVLSSFIAADYPDWSKGSLSLTFTICMAFFCLGGLAGGILSKRIPVRVNVLISAVLFLAGFFLASRAQTLPALYIGYGVLCGSGSGFAYNAVLNIMPRWFPNNQGLISGVLLMGFGASSLIIGSVFTAVTPAETGGWRASFLFMGVLIAVILVVCSFFFIPPKPGELPAPKTTANAAGASGAPDLTTGQMLRKSSFWLFWVWAILLSGVGLAIIAQAKPIAAMVGTGLSAESLALIVGLISVCNGLGRILTGALFDRIGHKATMLFVNVLSVVSALILILALATHLFPLVVVGFLGAGIAYGGSPTLSAAYTRAVFGQKNFPVNLSIMNLQLLVASFFGTFAGMLYDASGSYMTTFIMLVACAGVAFLFLAAIKSPKAPAAVSADAETTATANVETEQK